MSTQESNVDALIEAAKHLTREDRERLLAALLQLPQPVAQKHRITEMRGLGKELWGVDGQDYVDAERDLWER